MFEPDPVLARLDRIIALLEAMQAVKPAEPENPTGATVYEWRSASGERRLVTMCDSENRS